MAENRERWGGRLPFVMAAVGSAVGLGNVWRFPKTAYDNGGGAFLIPYFVALITAGIPLLIVEYTLGQKFQKGAPGALASLNKKFRWVGWFALLVGSMISFYYVAIMAHAWHYSIASATLEWTKPVPIRVPEPIGVEEKVIGSDKVQLYLKYDEAEWEDKEELERYKEQLREIVDAETAWGTEVTLFSADKLSRKEVEQKLLLKETGERVHFISLDENSKNYFYEKCLGGYVGYSGGQWRAYCAENNRINAEIGKLEGQKKVIDRDKKLTKAEKGERKDKLDETIGGLASQRISYVEEMFRLPWQSVIWCAVTWFIIFLIIFKGVHIVGKVVMWTVSLPVILLAILLVRGITLPGAAKGIIFYLTPKWEELANPSVWLAAYGQIFFSLSVGFGILIAYASYKPRDSEITNNAFITAFADAATSFFAAFAVFSVLGYLAAVNNTDVDKVVEGGVGLVFVTYPIAIAKIGGVWARVVGILFFGCLLLLGIDSAFSIVEGVLTGVKDKFSRASKTLITAAFCLVGFGASLFFATSSGLMWLDIVDNWMCNYGLVMVGLLECIAVAYFFHHHEIEAFANERSEIKLGGWFEVFIKYVTPAVLIFLLGARFIKDMQEPYRKYDEVIPWSVSVAGWGVLVGMITLALALGRNWTKFFWLVSAGAVFALFWWWLGRTDVAGMAAVGTVLLFGGFFTCLRLAMKSGADKPQPAVEQPGAES